MKSLALVLIKTKEDHLTLICVINLIASIAAATQGSHSLLLIHGSIAVLAFVVALLSPGNAALKYLASSIDERLNRFSE